YGIMEYFECSSAVIVLCAVGFCLLSMANSFRLPKVNAAGLYAVDKGEKKGLPTVAALKILVSPEARFLSLGLVLAFAATTAYYGYISLFYAEVIGIKPSRIGLYLSIGVMLEIVFILMMPLLQR